MRTGDWFRFSFGYRKKGETKSWVPTLENDEIVPAEQPRSDDKVQLGKLDDGRVLVMVEMEPDVDVGRLDRDEIDALCDEMSSEAEKLADQAFREYLETNHRGDCLEGGLRSHQTGE